MRNKAFFITISFFRSWKIWYYNFYERCFWMILFFFSNFYVVVNLYDWSLIWYNGQREWVAAYEKSRVRNNCFGYCHYSEGRKRINWFLYTIVVTIAKRIHLFPFRTQKLSFFTPKVVSLTGRKDRSLPHSTFTLLSFDRRVYFFFIGEFFSFIKVFIFYW